MKFKIHSVSQYAIKFRLKCKRNKMDLYPELIMRGRLVKSQVC